MQPATPKRFALALVVVALLLVAGCASTGGPGAPSAATVNGTTISMASFQGDLDAFAQNNEVREAFGFGEPFTEGEDTSYSTEFTAQMLSFRIASLLVEQELTASGQSATDQDRQQAQQTLDQVPATADLPEDIRLRLVDELANQQALSRVLEEAGGGATVTDEEVRQYYDENVEAFMSNLGGESACLSHILIAFDPTNFSAVEPTPEQDADARARAEDAVERVRAGEDFATVAAVSDDTASAAEGGDLGCIGRGTGYPPAFEEAALTQPIGEVGDPVRTEFGYHVLLVRTQGVVPFEEIQDDIRAQLEQSAQESGGSLGPWLQEAATTADVSVDGRFGTFDPSSGGLVVPPDGPTPASVPLGGLDQLEPEGQTGASDPAESGNP